MRIMTRIRSFISLARPHQYLKNIFVILPLFFAGSIQHMEAAVMACWAFAAFCFASSSAYVLNDLLDINEDRAHPQKKNRPLAKGEINTGEAVAFMLGLLVVTLCMSIFLLPMAFVLIIATYFSLNLIYSFSLKHHAILDIICIGFGFVLRVLGGGAATNIHISKWIILMTFLLAVFLSLAKRRDDILLLSETNGNIRRSLDGYNLEFVSAAMVIMASVVIVSYILYAVSQEVIAKHGTDNLYITSFWVVIGLLRYLQITLVKQRSGSPTMVVLHDRFMQVVILLWIGTFAVLIYGKFLGSPSYFKHVLVGNWL